MFGPIKVQQGLTREVNFNIAFPLSKGDQLHSAALIRTNYTLTSTSKVLTNILTLLLLLCYILLCYVAIHFLRHDTMTGQQYELLTGMLAFQHRPQRTCEHFFG